MATITTIHDRHGDTMPQTDYIPHPSDQIRNIKGIIKCMRLAIGGLAALDSIPSEGEIWGMFMVLDHVDDRLETLDVYLEKTGNPAYRAAVGPNTPGG